MLGMLGRARGDCSSTLTGGDFANRAHKEGLQHPGQDVPIASQLGIRFRNIAPREEMAF